MNLSRQPDTFTLISYKGSTENVARSIEICS